MRFAVAQLGGGLFIGALVGYVGSLLLRHLRLGTDTLYPVMALAVGSLAYGTAAQMGASGFLAAFVAGILVGALVPRRRRGIQGFHAGLASVADIGLFLVLGLLVFPSQLPGVALTVLAVAAVLTLIARPLAVLVAALPAAGIGWRESAVLGWTGLRGAVPIVLATFPFAVGHPDAQAIFNVVFFVVLLSTAVQGATVTPVVRALGLATDRPAWGHVAEALPLDGVDVDIVEVMVTGDLPITACRLQDAPLPPGMIAVAVIRADRTLVPRGELPGQPHPPSRSPRPRRPPADGSWTAVPRCGQNRPPHGWGATMAVAAAYENLSPSTARALEWAAAAALLRTGGPERSPEITAADLLVGVLLSHPDGDGEGIVLLSHFGLTARDVLPPGYPGVDAASLRRWAARVDPDTTPPLSADANAVLGMAQSLSPDGVVHLRSLLGGLLGTSDGDLWTPLHQALAATGTPLDALAGVYQRWVVDPASAGSVAGRALRDMLTREFRRRPIDLPTYASDEVDGGDLIGIRAEVDAFAYLLASRDLAPPLAVGLFGNWGAGKSFLMSAVKRRIEQLGEQIRDDPPQDVRFWKHIRQIDFNAWQYVQGSLWASLLDHIFGALDDLRTVGLLQRRREAVSTELREARVERLRRADRRQDAAEQVAKRRGQLTEAQRQRDEGLRLLPEQAAEARAEEVAALRQRATAALRSVWGTQQSELIGRDTAALLTAVQTTREEVRRGRALLGPYWTDERVRTAALVSAAFLAGAAGLALLLDAFDLPAVIGWLGPAAAAVPTATKLLGSVNRWSGARLDELEAVEAAVQEEIARRRADLDAAVARAQRRLEEAQADLEEAREEERAARARSDELQVRLGQLTPGRVLGDFLAERSRSDDYRRHLGLLSMVRDDLRQLEELITQNNENVLANKHDEGQTNRIILYIDDLDRCPADKVVEVLEAVHLLLAFRLFVVVVAVDTRWLRHALRTQLPALGDGAADRVGDPAANGHRATPQDYLEKIFQLPFQVQPLADDGRAALIRGLLEPSVGRDERLATGEGSTSALRVGAREEQMLEAMLSRRGSDPRREAQLLTLSRDELRFLESLAPLLGDTPRGVKRFVNVFQLLTILSGADGSVGAPTDREVLAFLAALHHGRGTVAEDLFERVDAGVTGPLEAVVDQLPTTDLPGRDRLAAWLDERPAWAGLDVQRLRQPLPLVRRLSFSEQL